jgi:hypothetical protein
VALAVAIRVRDRDLKLKSAIEEVAGLEGLTACLSRDRRAVPI